MERCNLMKIAYFVTEFPKISESFILNQITGMIENGHPVEIFSQEFARERKVHPDVVKFGLAEKIHYYHGVPENKIVRIFKALQLILRHILKWPGPILNSLNILKYGREAWSFRLLFTVVPLLECDIIHCHFGVNGLFGLRLKELGVKGKLVTSFHGYDVNSYPKRAGKDVYRDLFQKGDRFTTNTVFTKKKAMELGCREELISIFPEGLKIEKYRAKENTKKPGEKVIILTVGRLVEKKGHRYLIEALAKIIEKEKNIEYRIAGDGPLKDSLQSLVKNLGIEAYVKFLGLVEESEVLSLYESSDIFVLPSVTASDGDMEGQALVVQEAQAMGLPVVTTRHNGIPEGVLEGESALLADEKDANGLAAHLTYLLEHPEVWSEMGKKGREFVLSRYGTREQSEKLLSMYESLLP